MIYEDENHQFCTVVRNGDRFVTLTHPKWGTFDTNFNGSIDWNGHWRKSLAIGDKVPVFREERGMGYAYMTGFELHTSEEKIKDFINRPQQEAFVKGVIHQDNKTYIDCWSPVWKKIELCEPNYFSAKRGDTLIVERKVIAQDNVSVTYKFNLVRNKTLEDEQTAWINKTLSGFTDAERNRVLIESDLIRIKEAENKR